ncbi:MAG: carboxypeptidase-like regulatory domain-containing protein, partial [Bacteroidales bacterium]|nr:carboxypeptidase-like regulatory domain-containing protein [Bacteroidales bacterium]
YDGVHHLSHVRGDLKFRYRYRRSLFNNSFHLFFELVNTQIETDNVVRFDRRELEPTHNVFLDNSWVYDQVFWNDQNIIPPEKSVFDALNEISAKVEEIRFE